ncbi:hypothetical protein [Paenibacillus lutimineralis]|uniref:Uncharacterized protein n=1 Tax=Paenibacillus lutimineralis TaxID=2707005 RepID=A0A3S9UYH9_9BACL|nr:hypothetical protein [Paenibacillus lutimineralis]AZS15376.1 hypothetical protein EI981_13480 [Paenibacillus lutimineralis]
MQVGRKIYWDKATGNVLVDTGERSGSVRETTQEEDFAAYQALAERVPDTVGCLQLEYGQYTRDFAECNSYRVNLDTLELEFSYPGPGETEPTEPVYRKPLSVEVDELKAADIENKQAIAELTMMIAAPVGGDGR